MAFRELVFTVPEDLAESLGDALMELGSLSISVSDAAADTEQEKPLYGEPGLTPDRNAWEQSQVIALFDEQGLNAQEILNELSEAGFQVAPPTERSVEEQDWVRLTQSQFDPIQVGHEPSAVGLAEQFEARSIPAIRQLMAVVPDFVRRRGYVGPAGHHFASSVGMRSRFVSRDTIRPLPSSAIQQASPFSMCRTVPVPPARMYRTRSPTAMGRT